MESQADRGQVIVELLIFLTLLLAFFWLADSLTKDAHHAQAQNRFPSKNPITKVSPR